MLLVLVLVLVLELELELELELDWQLWHEEEQGTFPFEGLRVHLLQMKPTAGRLSDARRLASRIGSTASSPLALKPSRL
jgi:hypothetical protein